MKLVFVFSFLLFTKGFSQTPIPALVKQGDHSRLMVDGKPFIILGGELGNSTATTMQNMEAVWPKLKAMNLNTVLIPVYWELIEPKQGKFDFTLYKNLISAARNNNLKIVFLWFGSWKNSMSSHAPAWVKLNTPKYPRVKDDQGISQEILSSFSPDVLNADRTAFENLMKFIKGFDAINRTVIMMQVENEIGMLPSARDYQYLANASFKSEVPDELIQYLRKNKERLVPEFRKIWETMGYKNSGSWEEIFGQGLYTDEIFMAYWYSKFANALAEAGKKIYPLPMFVNAALNRPGVEPGKYPSAGPLPHLMDVWKAAGNAIDFFSPDFYNPDFKHWCDLYTRQGDLLFIPEHQFDQTVAAKSLFAMAHYRAIGFAPFSIESKDKPEDEPLGKMYKLIHELTPLFCTQSVYEGVLLSKISSDTILRIGEYELHCKHDYTLSWTPGSRTETWPLVSAAIIQSGDHEFYVAGTGIVITFKSIKNNKLRVGLLKVDEGNFIQGRWKINRHLNGDQTHQGRHVNIPTNQFKIQRVELYTYE